MIIINNIGIILEKTSLDFENQAVLNPACINVDGIVHMFYRAVKNGNFSSIGYCQIKDNKVIYRSKIPVIVPEFEYEKHGVEDPRIVYLEGIYYIFYVAYDGLNARVALATSRDLISFEKKGVISSEMTYDKAEDFFKKSMTNNLYSIFEKYYREGNGDKILLWGKDTFIFPKRINGKIAMLHRVLPGIQVAYFDDFSDLTNQYWEKYFLHMNDYVVLEPKFDFENFGIGGGCPPVETDLGWIFIYHAIEERSFLRTYHAGVALLDKNNPTKVIARLSHPLFSPIEKWEKNGDVNNVVFPTSAIINGENLDIYYGAADCVIALKKVNIKSLLDELLNK